MVAFSARPLMPLKHHLPAAQLNETSIERLFLVLVPIDVGIQLPLLWLRSPIRCTVSLPARFESFIANKIHWALKCPSRLDDKVRKRLPFTFTPQIKSGFPPRSLLQTIKGGSQLVRREVWCRAQLGKILSKERMQEKLAGPTKTSGHTQNTCHVASLVRRVGPSNFARRMNPLVLSVTCGPCSVHRESVSHRFVSCRNLDRFDRVICADKYRQTSVAASPRGRRYAVSRLANERSLESTGHSPSARKHPSIFVREAWTGTVILKDKIRAPIALSEQLSHRSI